MKEVPRLCTEFCLLAQDHWGEIGGHELEHGGETAQ